MTFYKRQNYGVSKMVNGFRDYGRGWEGGGGGVRSDTGGRMKRQSTEDL